MESYFDSQHLNMQFSPSLYQNSFQYWNDIFNPSQHCPDIKQKSTDSSVHGLYKCAEKQNQAHLQLLQQKIIQDIHDIHELTLNKQAEITRPKNQNYKKSQLKNVLNNLKKPLLRFVKKLLSKDKEDIIRFLEDGKMTQQKMKKLFINLENRQLFIQMFESKFLEMQYLVSRANFKSKIAHRAKIRILKQTFINICKQQNTLGI